MTNDKDLIRKKKPKERGLSGGNIQDARHWFTDEDRQSFGATTQEPHYDGSEKANEYTPKQRVRIRVPVPIARSRSAREHAVTVVRRRPLVPYTRSNVEIELTPSPTARRVITRTRIRNANTIDVENNLGDDYSSDFPSNTNRLRVTVTRKRVIKPTTIESSIPKITRKKLISVRPIPIEPTSTLAIITAGFFTVPPDEEDEDYYDDIEDSELPTPDLHTTSEFRNVQNTLLYSIQEEAPSITTSAVNDPIIITDHFFFPGFYEETTTSENKLNDNEETSTEVDKTIDPVTENKSSAENANNPPETEESKFPDTTLSSVNDEVFTTMIASGEIKHTTIYSLDENKKNVSTDVSGHPTQIPQHVTEVTMKNAQDSLRVIPILKSSEIEPSSSTKVLESTLKSPDLEPSYDLAHSEIPTVIPLETVSLFNEKSMVMKTEVVMDSDARVNSSLPVLTPEDVEAGLTDDLYLSLSRPDFPQILPSNVGLKEGSLVSDSNSITPELQTSIYYSETIVTSTRLRTYTYVVTKLNGQDTEVTSSTTVRPRATTLTLTVPVTVTVTPTLVIAPSVTLNSSLVTPLPGDTESERIKHNDEVEDEGRRFNLATRVMSNGVEVIVAGTTPAYRWENSNPQPTLTLSEAVVMLLPQDKPNEFVTKTCTTTFTYLNTITRDGTTTVSTDQQVIANTATEERHRKPASEAASVTLEASPTLQTEVFKTTYTYLTLNADHPDEKNALGSSTKVIANTVTAPQYYLDMILEPSEIPRPETNTYFSTRILEKTYVGEDGKSKIETTNDVVTQLIITESAPPPRPTSVTTTLMALDGTSTPSDIAKTYFITYTYYNTYLEKDSTVVKTNIATSSDVVYEKATVKKSPIKSAPVSATPEPIRIFATKTYLTTFTYFTTLLQAGTNGETSTTTSSHTQVVENVITESIAPSLLDAGYMNALLTTSHHSDTLKNVVTGSTIIFFDDEEQINPTASSHDTSTTESQTVSNNSDNVSSSSVVDSVGSETNDATSRPLEPDNSYNEEEIVEEATDPPPSKRPSQVSNLLSLGSLGINSLSALGPVITAMAGLLQGKTTASRRNDTEPATESPVTTTQRSPIYIPVGEFADGDIETAESQNIALHLANSNHLPETRHKVTSSLADGIPISPGEIITANSDVIIGKPGKSGPRPPQTFLNDGNIGMKPPPISIPNIPVHPVLEVVEKEPLKGPIKIQKGSQQLEILPAHQIYEEHIKVPVHQSPISRNPENTHQVLYSSGPPKRISSKQDILENDPLLIPPSSISKIDVDLKSREKSRRPWSSKDPLGTSDVLFEEKHQLNLNQKGLFSQIDNIGTISESTVQSHGPEPIVHQVPHVIDRSTGQPLLVNIQPSQVANVVIPQGGTQALIFGDTNEPHISGQYFDDPSPYPEPEVGPGFVGIDKVENLPQFSKNENPTDYMTPPSPPKNFNSVTRTQIIPLSQNHNIITRPDKVPARHHDNFHLSTGQGHVHSEILVHHGSENDLHSRLQSRPKIPSRNHQNPQFPPRREHTNIHIPPEQTPPRRTEVTSPTDNSYFESANTPGVNDNWKNDKKTLRNPQIRWSRPTARTRTPTRVIGRPYSRPIRPLNSIRQPQLPYTPKVTSSSTHYQNEYTKYNQPAPTVSTTLDSTQPIYGSKIRDKVNFSNGGTNLATQQHFENHANINSKQKINDANKDNGDYGSGGHLVTPESEHVNHSAEDDFPTSPTNHEKTNDSEVEASENVKVTSGTSQQQNDEPEGDSDEQTEMKFDQNYSIKKTSMNIGSIITVRKPSQDSEYQNSNDKKDEEIIVGSEKKHDRFSSQFDNQNDQHPSHLHEIINLKPPARVPVLEPNGHSRPFSKPHSVVTDFESKPEIITKSPETIPGHILPGLGQVIRVQTDKSETGSELGISRPESHKHRGRPRPDHSTRLHPDYSQIITMQKPQVPRPVIISSGQVKKPDNYRRPSVQFSLPIDSTGEENESNTQTERAPSLNTVVNKPKEESLDTAFQTNFASTDSKKESEGETEVSAIDIRRMTTPKTNVIAQDMLPPPPTNKNVNNELIGEELEPPPSPTDVLGLSPPPVDLTTTIRSIENKSNLQKVNTNVSGLRPPPLYIPLKESKVTPPPPSTSMIPPSLKPSVVRPYLVDILSQDMVPPLPDVKTTQTLDVATVRPGVAVSGSIQIATAVATSHIPVIQDMESKIPIVHGTVDLPVVVDVPEFLKPIDTKKPDHVSIYTVLPFETKQRNTIRPTPTRSLISTTVQKSQINQHINTYAHPTRPSTPHRSRRPGKQPDFSIVLEPSHDIHLPSTKIEPTKSLETNKRSKHRPTVLEPMTKVSDSEGLHISKNFGKSSVQNQSIRKTDLKIKESASKMMEIIGTVVHEFMQNSTNDRVEIKPQEVTRFETLTVTRTETSVLGSPPTTRTLLITHTLTSTRVETVTETLLRPTSVISTITSTILQSVTHVPAYDNANDNESIFVVMSDQKPPAPGTEEVEAEYGEEDISRDEQDVSGNEIHRVLSGGIIGAPSVPIRPPKVQCIPECKAFKSEVCAESNGEMHCICRPGFARMFPDRPCKPTYTFTVGVGLERLGRDRFTYETGMNDTNSVIFRRYAHPIREALDRTLMQSDLRDVYRGLNIAKFLRDPAKVLFNVRLSSNTDETRLKEVIRKYLVLSNYSLGGTEVYASKDLGMVEAHDFDECTTDEGGPHHDCSPHAACFNLRGSYQCSCREGWADISENPAYPGRTCSQAPLGCAACNNKGHCVVNTYGQDVCECFPWHSGKKCQINLKVLLIALVTTGVVLLGLLAVCLGMACLRSPNRRRTSADRRAMISGMGGDTSSEGSVAELAIPHHVPHILPPPPQMMAPAPPMKKNLRKISGKPRRAPKKPAPVIAPAPVSNSCPANEQRDRSLTVMIPRAKYRSVAQGATPQNYKPMSTFAVDEHKLIDYLEGGAHPGNRKPSLVSTSDYKESEHRLHKQQQQQQQQHHHSSFTPSGALVSAGFQVSATVTRALDAESTLARSCGETTVEQATKLVRSTDFPSELETSLVRSCADAAIHASTKQLLRLDLADAGSTLARSCGETTIQPPTKIAEMRNRDARDSASEGHTMAERDLGSTLRLPAQHAALYNQDRTSSDRESNFDSL